MTRLRRGLRDITSLWAKYDLDPAAVRAAILRRLRLPIEDQGGAEVALVLEAFSLNPDEAIVGVIESRNPVEGGPEPFRQSERP